MMSDRRFFALRAIGIGVAFLLILTASFILGTQDAFGASKCGVQTHRFGSTDTIDDNTLEGLARSDRLGARAEGDLIPLTDGFAVYHENRWEQYTDGVGVPWQTSVAYADSLTTTPNHQQVVLLGQALTYAKRNGTRLFFEAHQWQDAWSATELRSAVAKVDRRNMMPQVWWSSTNGGLTALADIAPEATAVWRVDNDETPTRSYVESRSIEVLQVDPSRSAEEVSEWRSWGLKVQGRRTTREGFQEAYDAGLRTVQADAPKAWLDYCEGRQ